MPIVCRLLEQRDPYERTVTGWVDACETPLLEFNARLGDGIVDLEVSFVAEPSPSYLIHRASATARSEATTRACGDLLDTFARARGLRMASGFRRSLASLLGEHPGAHYLADAAVEAARLSRQVTQMSVPAAAERSPADFHRLDFAAWPELVDLCFTYRTESAALFSEREVRTPAVIEMYASAPGRQMVFHRYKRTHLARAGTTVSLYQSMFDQVHGFELWYDLDDRTHEIRDARLLAPRLPYMGICDEPQRRVRDMIGATMGPDWVSTVRARLGGRQGCFQLTDLTSDLFRFLRFE